MSDSINYGIDLGTTNSSIAKCDGDEVRIFKNRDQMDVTPSVVRIEKTGRIIVGRRAYQTLSSDSQNVAAEFKRWMGQSDLKNFKSAGKSLSAEELSAEILKSLLEDARRQTTDSIIASVITVPAAFGQLQCEATARAAMLAGLKEAPLLQEPLAASIAYGMKPDARDKHWLVYDLGGGTFDIAVVSTRNGQLSVLEHQGNNMLGCKDLDRLMLEEIFWPRLQEFFNMPSPDSDAVSWRKLVHLLRGKAEEAKIDLSLSDQATVSVFNAGNDENGIPIEAELEVNRTELNQLVEPFIAKTIELCRRAMDKAHINTTGIANIVLVGGPTHMPIVREMLTAELGVALDFGIDPMTVVSRGAAIYASTLPLEKRPLRTIMPEAININLSHETVWSETTCLVAGRIDSLPMNMDFIEILIEEETGHWNSGWLPVQKGYFETKVHLLEGKINLFWIYLRDAKGNDLTPNPDSFSVRHGLTLAEPPLPHSIGAEVVRPDGKTEIDVIFPRSTPLPAKKIITYKANKRLKPSQTGDYLAIKIWEGEYPEPKSNTYVGALRINSRDIRRPLPEGADIEVSIAVNASRLMEVQAFIPVLNQHFEERVYVPKDNEEVMVQKAHEVNSEIDEYDERLEDLDELSQQLNDSTIRQEVNELKVELEKLAEEHYQFKSQKQNDPDDSKRIVQQSKEIRGQLSEIDKKIKSGDRLLLLLRNVQAQRGSTEEIVKTWGERLEQKQYELLCREADRQIEREDEKALDKIASDFRDLKWHVLFKQDWYWKQSFDDLCHPGVPFVNKNEARRLITSGQDAVKRGDGAALRKVVSSLWELQPKSSVETGKEKALEAGIKRNLR